MKRKPWTPTPAQEITIREMAANNQSYAAIAKAMEVTEKPLKRWLETTDIVVCWVRPKPKRHQQTTIVPGEVQDKVDPNWVSPAKRFRHLYR